MAQRVGIAGRQASGKSYGRRYIPDGENVMLIAPSIKSPHLFTGPKGVEKMTPEEIDKAIEDGTRKMVEAFNVKDPTGKNRYTSIQDAIDKMPGEKSMVSWMREVLSKVEDDNYFYKDGVKSITGNILVCNNLKDLGIYLQFIDVFMPWIHTIILPDFTHFISEVITSEDFISRKAGGEAFSKYLDLAAAGLRQFIKKSDSLKPTTVVVTEFHVEYVAEEGYYEIFVPGGKMIKEKLLPSSYYDTFLFTDVKYGDDEFSEAQHHFVTRKIRKYPEARSIGNFKELFIPNNLQTVLTAIREYNNIPLKK